MNLAKCAGLFALKRGSETREELFLSFKLSSEESGMPAVKDRIKPHLEDAWLGDAVLELYVRSWILREYGKVDAELKSRFTSNQFLNSLGQPTMVEAEVGRIYKEQGLEGAFSHIQAKIEPLFVKQEGKRQRSQR